MTAFAKGLNAFSLVFFSVRTCEPNKTTMYNNKLFLYRIFLALTSPTAYINKVVMMGQGPTYPTTTSLPHAAIYSNFSKIYPPQISVFSLSPKSFIPHGGGKKMYNFLFALFLADKVYTQL